MADGRNPRKSREGQTERNSFSLEKTKPYSPRERASTVAGKLGVHHYVRKVIREAKLVQ